MTGIVGPNTLRVSVGGVRCRECCQTKFAVYPMVPSLPFELCTTEGVLIISVAVVETTGPSLPLCCGLDLFEFFSVVLSCCCCFCCCCCCCDCLARLLSPFLLADLMLLRLFACI